MTGNAELLNFIYQNSGMGVDTIGQINVIVNDPELKKQLNSQLAEYEKIHLEAKAMLNANGYEEKEINAFDKIRTYMMINIQTMLDKSPSHISEMLIIGSNMGIIDAIKNIRKYSNAESNILQLMQRLLSFEEDNVKSLKAFL